MKLKMNKASDLSSISVLPPQSRRLGRAENSMFGKPQAAVAVASQLRSQASQQSFSQGVSSQHGLFSQISQNSLDDQITNEQRFNSQERETSVKRNSCLVPVNYPQDESQAQISRPSASLMRKWSHPEYKCQISEELEHRIGTIEASLSRTGMVLESLQSDIIQVNKGTKELLLEMQSVRQKMAVHDDSLQLMNKGQEDIKLSFDRGLKVLSGKILDKSSTEKLGLISSTLSTLPQKVETSMIKLQRDIAKNFTKEVQALSRSLQVSKKECATDVISPPKVVDHLPSSKPVHSLTCIQTRFKAHQAPKVAKIDEGGWKSVKREEGNLMDRRAKKNTHMKGVPLVQQGKNTKVSVESDEDSEEDLFCVVKESGNNAMDDETQRILRKARRRKRKHSNTIFID